MNKITSYAGDVFYLNWDEVLVGATAVVSTIGGFGSEEQMQRINGEANVVAVKAAKDYGKWPQISMAVIYKIDDLMGFSLRLFFVRMNLVIV